MKILNKDWIIDLQKSILWQYDKAENLQALIDSKQAWYEKNVKDFIVSFFYNIFNIKTANDFGLNIWGKLLNFPRQVVNKNDGTIINLSTEQYRFLLLGQILKFKMSCTIPEINKYLSLIFDDTEGKCYVVDNMNMTMQYKIEKPISDEIQALLDNVDFLPRPAGVRVIIGNVVYHELVINVYDSAGNLITNSSNISLVSGGETVTGNTIIVEEGSDISWSVSKTDYISQSGVVENIQEDQTINITLVGIHKLLSVSNYMNVTNIVTSVIKSNIDTTKTLLCKEYNQYAGQQYCIVDGKLMNGSTEILVDGTTSYDDWTYIGSGVAIRDKKIYWIESSSNSAILLDDTYQYKACSSAYDTIGIAYGITEDDKLYRIVFDKTTVYYIASIDFVASDVSFVIGSCQPINTTEMAIAYFISDGKLYAEKGIDQGVPGLHIPEVTTIQIGSATNWTDVSSWQYSSAISKPLAINSNGQLFAIDGTTAISLDNGATGWTKLYGNTYQNTYALGIKNGDLYKINYDGSNYNITLLNSGGWSDIGGGIPAFYGFTANSTIVGIKNNALYRISPAGTINKIDDTVKYLSCSGYTGLERGFAAAYAIVQVI